MGTRERRQRDYDEREELFLDAALEQVRRDGLLSLQMGRLAEQSEYSVGTLYQHFESKEDLLLALVTRSLQRYTALVHKALAWKATTRDRMFAVGVADLVFLQKHNDYSQIAQYSLCDVFWNAASTQRRQAFLDVSKPLMETVCNLVEEARRVGDLAEIGPSSLEVTLGIWSICRGHQNLSHIEGLLADITGSNLQPMMCRHLVFLLDGMRWKPMSKPANLDAPDRLFERVRDEVFRDEIGVIES